MRVFGLWLALLAVSAVSAGAAETDRQLLWGDTHLHTSYSFDAFLNGNQSADPDVAYRYAKGQPVIHPYNRTRVRIGTPLDFLVVSDHAEFYGGIRDIYLEGIQDPDPNLLERLAYWYRTRQIRDAIDAGRGPEYFASLLPVADDPVAAAARWNEVAGATPPGAEVSKRNAWDRLRTIAEAHNEPGRFTAFLGWEWSSVPGGANLHRVVVTDADGEAAGRFLPFSSADSPYPEDLWSWLEGTSTSAGVRFVAIPHNSNISKGQMFARHTLRGEPISAQYARTRRRWEPVVEVTQIKGDSETHPELSPDDPFADFERYPWYIQQDRGGYQAQPGDFIRTALRTGLSLEKETGENPYRFGLIGSTDAHSGLASAEEPNFWGKMGYDSIPENKQGRRTSGAGPTGWSMSASGLAAVWAEENSRTSILDAFERREVYATSGPRIRVRLFGGWSFTRADLESGDVAAIGYAKGVPMGGRLRKSEAGAAPTFVVTALKDPESANLDRVQIVKGWIDAAGETHERVFDVAWSPGRALGADGAPEPVGDTVDRRNGTWTDDIGAAQLSGVWSDPAFDPAWPSFYYARILEIPTPRHSLYDAIALGLEAPSEGPSVIQERAYTSPIWYSP